MYFHCNHTIHRRCNHCKCWDNHQVLGLAMEKVLGLEMENLLYIGNHHNHNRNFAPRMSMCFHCSHTIHHRCNHCKCWGNHQVLGLGMEKELVMILRYQRSAM